MGAEAKRYLQEHSIPQLFEGLMTGLIYNRPNDPIQFLENAITKVRQNPGLALNWDTFVNPEAQTIQQSEGSGKGKTARANNSSELLLQHKQKTTSETGGKAKKKEAKDMVESKATTETTTNNSRMDQAKPRVNTAASSGSQMARSSRDSSQPARKSSAQQQQNGSRSRQSSHSVDKHGGSNNSSRPSSLAQLAQNAYIPPDAPIILFMGGPGGGKTRYAAQLQEQLRSEGLVHICMPDLVRTAIARYKDRLPEWRLAAERYQRGELIPNELAQQLVKAEMGRYPNARAYFLEGFPREALQVEDFERNVRPVDMALILDYDEEVLRRHMQSRGLLPDVINRRIDEFKQKTLPSAKYFDDQRLLHLIPGEKEDAVIIERMKKLALRAIRIGVQAGGGRANGANAASSTSASSSTAGGGENHQIPDEKNGGDGKPLENGIGTSDGNDVANDKIAEKANAVVGKQSSDSPIRMDQTVSVAANEADTRAEASNNGTSKPASSAISKQIVPSTDQSQQQQQVPRSQQQSTMQNKPGSSSGMAKEGNSRTTTTAATAATGVVGPNEVAKETAGNNNNENRVGSAGDKTPNGSGSATIKLVETSSGAPSSAVQQQQPGTTPIAAIVDPFPKGLPSDAPVILLIGAPGSNKSKFAQRIARKYDGFLHISMGELFRRKVLQNGGEDELWRRIGKKMDAGEIIPMRICREILYSALHEKGQNSWGYVIEGYPRTFPQAEEIEAQLGRLDLAILIDCTEQFCRDAIQARYQKNKEEGAERPDDDENVVRLRLNLFKQNTLPMLKHLDDKGLLRVIEGDTNEEKVFQEICSVIDNTIFIQDDGNGKSLESSKKNSIDEAATTTMEQQQNQQQSLEQQQSTKTPSGSGN